MKYTKTCTVCDQPYETYNPRSVACSLEHLSEWRRRMYRGRKFTPQHVARQNAAKSDPSWIRRGDYKCEACGKEFDTNTGLRSHRSYCSASDEPRDVACEECGRVFTRRRNMLMHLKFHAVAYAEEHARLVKDALADRAPQKRNSGAELEFLEQLRVIHPDVVHKHRIDGINHEFDFFVPFANLIVEYDGDYWHGNRALYDLTPAMKRQYWLDQTWTRAAIERGFTIHRVWASEAVNYPNKLRIMD